MAEDLISVLSNGVERKVALWPGIDTGVLEKSIQASFGTQARISLVLRVGDNVVVPLEYLCGVRRGAYNVIFDAGAPAPAAGQPGQPQAYAAPPGQPGQQQPYQQQPYQAAPGQPGQQPYPQQGQPGQPAPGQPGAAGAPQAEEDDDDETPVDRSGMKADHEGWLDKKGDKGFLGSKLWVKRWFRLYGAEKLMCYFKNEKTFIQTGAIPLSGALLVEKTSDKSFSFNVTMKTTARVWRLNAKDESTREGWISRISPLLKAFHPPPAWKPSKKKKGLPPVYPVKWIQGTADIEQSCSSRHDDKTQVAEPVVPYKPNDGDVHIQLWGKHKAFVQEFRHVDLDDKKGAWLSNLPRKLKDKESGIFVKSHSDPKATVLQQQFYLDDKTEAELLKKLIGKDIEVEAPRDRQFDEKRTFKGTVIYDAKEQRFALYDKATNTVHFLKNEEGMTFKLLENNKAEKLTNVEGGLFYEPSVHWVIDSETKQHLVEVDYELEEAFAWFARYNAVINHDENELEFTGWFDIHNKAGKTYEGASITIIHDPEDDKPEEEEKKEESVLPIALPSIGFGSMLGALTGAAPKVEPPKPRWHKYTVAQKPVLADDKHRQLRILTVKLPVESKDLIRFDTPKFGPLKPVVGQNDGTSAESKIESVIEFRNVAEHGLGIPLPAGTFDVSRRERDGFGIHHLSTSSIGHQDVHDIMTIVLEPLEHVTATRKQTGFNLDRDKLFCVETVEITVANGRSETVELVVEEQLFRWQTFEITNSAPAHEKHPHHPRKITWKVKLNQGEDITLAYTVFYSQFVLD